MSGNVSDTRQKAGETCRGWIQRTDSVSVVTLWSSNSESTTPIPVTVSPMRHTQFHSGPMSLETVPVSI